MIERAYKEAMSMVPGTKAPGAYIGSKESNGNIYHFFCDDKGNYWYYDEASERIEKEMKAARKARAAVNSVQKEREKQ